MPDTGTYVPSTFDWVREQVELYERTDGREGGTVDDQPVVILTTVGARSGSTRKSPVVRLERDGVYAAIGSVGGFPKNPAWYHNLLADPHCQLQDGAVKRAMLAREAVGDERREWWDRAVAAYPHFSQLQAKTDRQFPIMLFSAEGE